MKNQNPSRYPLCGRVKESELLLRYARASENVVVSGPRRIGKTTLVRHVAADVEKKGGVAAFCDLYGVFSVAEIASRIARAVFQVTRQRENFWDKARKTLTGFRPILRVDEEGMGLSVAPVQNLSGLDLLREALEGLSRFVRSVDTTVLIILDEFQEIREIEDGIRIQALMREHMQFMRAAFFFVGSRRRLLEDMFTDRKKPFYQSALHMRVGPLSRDEIIPWVERLFTDRGIQTTPDTGGKIAAICAGSPYYLQLVCNRLCEVTDQPADPSRVRAAWEETLELSAPLFEASITGLSTGQKKLLAALAKEPSASILGSEFLARHALGAASSMQKARDALIDLDLIFREADQPWNVTDPGLRDWLCRLVV